MKQRKFLFILALLCAMTQGAWADTWDGHTLTHPGYNALAFGQEPVIYISRASDLAYIREHWDDDDDYYYYSNQAAFFHNMKTYVNKDYSEMNLVLAADIDMGDTPFTPLGTTPFTGKFYGENHTIRINIDGATKNYQGLFSEIGSDGAVYHLHVAGNIHCKESRLVGGICGENNGELIDCWVSANVRSDWCNSSSSNKAKVGGICGENNGTIEYCLMSGDVTNDDNYVGGLVGCNDGTVKHGVFYGERNSKHSQYDKYVGCHEKEEDLHDSFTAEGIKDYFNEFSSTVRFSSRKLYFQGILFCYSVTTNQQGQGSCSVSTPQPFDEYIRYCFPLYQGPNASPGNTIRVNRNSGIVKSITVTDSRGRQVAVSGDATHGYTFTMPNSNATVNIVYDSNVWPAEGDGSESSPYLIQTDDDWTYFSEKVLQGESFSGKYVSLVNSVNAKYMVGSRNDNKPFSGIFIGNGNTVNASIDVNNVEGVALFSYIKDATIKNLTVAGSLTGHRPYTGGLVGFADGATNLIEGCTVTASVNMRNSNNNNWYHAGGIVGNSLSSATTIRSCVFAGRIGHDSKTYNVAGILGWNNDDGSPTIEDCLEKGTFVNALSMHPISLQGSTGSMSRCYYLHTQVGTPDRVCTAGRAIRAMESAEGEVCRKQMLTDDRYYYIPCIISGIEAQYTYTGNPISISTPTVTDGDGRVLTEGTDYDYAPLSGTVQELGDYTVAFTGKGQYSGTKNLTFTVRNNTAIASTSTMLTSGAYSLTGDVTIGERITISGDVELYLTRGNTLTATKGIELAEGNSLTIYGPGALVIDGCDEKKSGIGSTKMGTLTIHGGQLTVAGGSMVYGIGSDGDCPVSGSVTLGWTDATDFVSCVNYSTATTTFARRFVHDGAHMIASAINLGRFNKKIVPYLPDGTENNPYIIDTADDWDEFASQVNAGTVSGYNGKFVVLSSDISVTTMVGTDGNHTFRGTFDGGGHTLTFSQGTEGEPFDEEFCAPFRYTYGATIKNLHTAGTIFTAGTNAGGVVGRNGTALTTLQDVSSSVAINSVYAGRAYHGGLMGYAINATFTRCAFKGQLLGEASDHCGGLLGQKSATDNTVVSFTDCLFAPTEVTVSDNLSYPFAAGDATKASVGSGCYYTALASSTQGTQVYNEPVKGINKKVTAVDGKSYYMPCIVGNVQEGYLYGPASIEVAVPTVTAADGTHLTPGEDFTYASDPAPVSNKGQYTLTVSAAGENYSGQEQFTFQVGDYLPVTSSTKELSEQSYMVYNDVVVNDRIVINAPGEYGATLYLAEGKTLYARKGIELAEGHRLTIYGPGALVIDDCDSGKSGIGAATAGSLTIMSGQFHIKGGAGAAGIGSYDPASPSGNLSVYWNNTSDYVYCTSYALSSNFNLGYFVIDGEHTFATTTNIGGKKIVPALVLQNNDMYSYNANNLNSSHGKQMAVVLDGRTICLDGYWNTLCLPFDYNLHELKDVEARTLTSATIEGTTLNLNFGDPVDKLEAGVPYIIRYTDDEYVDDGTHDLVNPVFQGVTIDNTLCIYNNVADGDQRVSFIGTYSSKTFSDEDKSILLMGGNNTLYYPMSGAIIGACRAYFKIGDGSASARITAFNLSFADSDDTQGIISAEANSSFLTLHSSFQGWYTLDGCRLQGQPTAPGIYINNGKKRLIK